MVYFGRHLNTNHHKQRLFNHSLNISMDICSYSNHDMNPYSPLTTTPSTTNPKHIAIYHTRGEPPPPIGDFAPVGYVERYCCCVVVSVIEREVIAIEIISPSKLHPHKVSMD